MKMRRKNRTYRVLKFEGGWEKETKTSHLRKRRPVDLIFLSSLLPLALYQLSIFFPLDFFLLSLRSRSFVEELKPISDYCSVDLPKHIYRTISPLRIACFITHLARASRYRQWVYVWVFLLDKNVFRNIEEHERICEVILVVLVSILSHYFQFSSECLCVFLTKIVKIALGGNRRRLEA